MPKKIEEKIHILSPYRGYLAHVNVMGPIVHPLCVDKSVAAKILMNGAELYEYIPSTKKTLKLTLSNINDPNRYAELDKKHVDTFVATAVTPVTKLGVPTITEPEVKHEEVIETVEDTITEENVIEEITEPAPEVKVEETVVTTETVRPASVFEFEYNEDGTVNESNIEWSKYTKNQRKELRAQINQHNASLKN